MTLCAEAKFALAIAVVALDATAVLKAPAVPSTSPLASKLNTASNLSRSLATEPASVEAVVVILLANASATPVISPFVNAN